MNLNYGGKYTFVYELPGGSKYEHYFSGQNVSAGFWTSTHREDKFEDFSKQHVAFQRWNQSVNIENVLNGPIPDLRSFIITSILIGFLMTMEAR